MHDQRLPDTDPEQEREEEKMTIAIILLIMIITITGLAAVISVGSYENDDEEQERYLREWQRTKNLSDTKKN